MDRIEKTLKKLGGREREKIKAILIQLRSQNFKGLDMKKLKGRDDIFRVRKGDIRIIYRVADKDIFVLAIERRNDRTYKF